MNLARPLDANTDGFMPPSKKAKMSHTGTWDEDAGLWRPGVGRPPKGKIGDGETGEWIGGVQCTPTPRRKWDASSCTWSPGRGRPPKGKIWDKETGEWRGVDGHVTLAPGATVDSESIGDIPIAASKGDWPSRLTPGDTEGYDGLKADHEGLKADHEGLKADHDGLNADHHEFQVRSAASLDALEATVARLELKNAGLALENIGLRAQIKNFQEKFRTIGSMCA
jgi:hypothetical protein